MSFQRDPSGNHFPREHVLSHLPLRKYYHLFQESVKDSSLPRNTRVRGRGAGPSQQVWTQIQTVGLHFSRDQFSHPNICNVSYFGSHGISIIVESPHKGPYTGTLRDLLENIFNNSCFASAKAELKLFYLVVTIDKSRKHNSQILFSEGDSIQS